MLHKGNCAAILWQHADSKNKVQFIRWAKDKADELMHEAGVHLCTSDKVQKVKPKLEEMILDSIQNHTLLPADLIGIEGLWWVDPNAINETWIKKDFNLIRDKGFLVKGRIENKFDNPVGERKYAGDLSMILNYGGFCFDVQFTTTDLEIYRKVLHKPWVDYTKEKVSDLIKKALKLMKRFYKGDTPEEFVIAHCINQIDNIYEQNKNDIKEREDIWLTMDCGLLEYERAKEKYSDEKVGKKFDFFPLAERVMSIPHKFLIEDNNISSYSTKDVFWVVNHILKFTQLNREKYPQGNFSGIYSNLAELIGLPDDIKLTDDYEKAYHIIRLFNLNQYLPDFIGGNQWKWKDRSYCDKVFMHGLAAVIDNFEEIHGVNLNKEDVAMILDKPGGFRQEILPRYFVPVRMSNKLKNAIAQEKGNRVILKQKYEAYNNLTYMGEQVHQVLSRVPVGMSQESRLYSIIAKIEEGSFCKDLAGMGFTLKESEIIRDSGLALLNTINIGRKHQLYKGIPKDMKEIEHLIKWPGFALPLDKS